jgi:hypothetical protein
VTTFEQSGTVEGAITVGRAKGKRKERSAPQIMVTGFDATPERLAKDESEIVPAALDHAGERQGRARKFRAAHLDRLHRAGSLTWVQWYAGDCYRNAHHRCQFPLSVVASYGERTSAGEHPGAFGFGLPRQEAQVRARQQLAAMRGQLDRHMIGFMDRFLIHDTMPRYGGRAAMRNMAEIRNALDRLAQYLRLT